MEDPKATSPQPEQSPAPNQNPTVLPTPVTTEPTVPEPRPILLRSQLIKLLMASLIAPLATALLGYLTYYATYHPTSSDSWASLGAAIVAFYVVLGAYPIALLLALRALHVRRWSLIGLFAILVLYACVGISGGLSANQIVNLAALLILELILLTAYWCIFNWMRVSKLWKCVLAVALGLGMAGVSYFVRAELVSHAEQQSNQQDKQQLQNYNFTVYAPSQLPEKYLFDGADDQSNMGSNDQASYFEINYRVNTDAPVITVRSFKKPNTFKPPSACGDSTPDFPNLGSGISNECKQIAISHSGSAVYYASPDATDSNIYIYYTVINGTEVTLEASESDNQLTNSEALTIMDSLQPKNVSQLQQLENQRSSVPK